MKQFYRINLTLIFVIILITSCSPRFRFVTKGLKNVDSSYVIETNGNHIDAAKIIVRATSVTVDGKKVDPAGLSAIKAKKMYFAVQLGSIYPAEYYGKINLLYQLTYTHSYNNSSITPYSGSTNAASNNTVQKGYFLQKRGYPAVVRLSRSAFLDFVADNPEAESLAKAHFIWQNTSWVSFAGFLGGTYYLVSSINSSKPLGAPIALMGGSVITHFVLTSIADHKLKKAIKVYNGVEQ